MYNVPETESQKDGFLYISASVAVLPEAEEVDVEINPADIKRCISCIGSRRAARKQNGIGSAVNASSHRNYCRMSGWTLKHKNYESAMKVLRTRLYRKKPAEHNKAIAKQRKTLVSTGDRSAKIRTYNHPQGRVTDHRINSTMYNLGEIMNGDLQTT